MVNTMHSMTCSLLPGAGPMASGRRPPRLQSAGFTYIGLLILVALTGIALSVVSQVWLTVQARDKEEDLLYVGNEIRRAIELYYQNTPPGMTERYPRRLEDLIKDPRYAGTRRYLRRIYRDPITGSREWGYQKAGDLITGVYSLSNREPVKKFEFRAVDQSFEGKTRYSEWIFTPRTGNRPVVIPPEGPGILGLPTPPRPGTFPNGMSR